MWRGSLLTGRGTWQNGSDVAIPEIRKEARVTSLMTSTIAFYKYILRIIHIIFHFFNGAFVIKLFEDSEPCHNYRWEGMELH